MRNFTKLSAEKSTAHVNEVVNLFAPNYAPKAIIICEHASNFIPPKFNNLGLNDQVIESHVAWDPGALAVSKLVAQSLSIPLIAQKISRLVYDCNRPPHSPTAMPAKSEVYDIIGNKGLTAKDKQSRVKNYYDPFNNAVSLIVDAQIALGNHPVIITIHSFTPVYNGKSRDVEIGVLHDKDTSFADRMLKVMQLDNNFITKRNEPYGPTDGVTHTLKQHAQSKGLPNVMLEIRNDLIADKKGQTKIANYLSDIIADCFAS